MSKYFGTPFAESGTKTTIPDAAQAGGEVSYAEGYTNDYTLDQTSNPNAKDIEIGKFNQLGNDLSGAIKDIQEQGVLAYRADVNNPVGAVKVGSDGGLYQCLIANGIDSTVVDPVGDTTGAWKILFGFSSVTGSATFTNSTNNIALADIGAIYGLEVGDVLQVSGSTNNDTEFTVEVITDDDNVIVNQAHAGGTTSKSLVDEAASCTVTLFAKAGKAEIGVGQGWVDVSANRTAGISDTNSTGRTMGVSIAVNPNATLGSFQVEGVDVGQHEDSANTSTQKDNINSLVPNDNDYLLTSDGDGVTVWSELR